MQLIFHWQRRIHWNAFIVNSNMLQAATLRFTQLYRCVRDCVLHIEYQNTHSTRKARTVFWLVLTTSRGCLRLEPFKSNSDLSGIFTLFSCNVKMLRISVKCKRISTRCWNSIIFSSYIFLIKVWPSIFFIFIQSYWNDWPGFPVRHPSLLVP